MFVSEVEVIVYFSRAALSETFTFVHDFANRIGYEQNNEIEVLEVLDLTVGQGYSPPN